ncbi:PLxRFG domain-containing protein [Photobacterium damselae]|uniref:PLxRFG domain-containing protein n=1 Tax=Photobacterium damselae TaxID=38293 RepID=UPI000D0765BE|nr:PLxRFG domain-containing protein [Photobacterium damselae]PSB81566.1 hypothetical protein C5F62_11975 [Photobacterium damselae subsp. damselae]
MEKEDNEYLKSLAEQRFGHDYQPSAAARSLREALGIDAQELADRDRGIATPKETPPAQPTIDAIRQQFLADNKREDQKSKLKRTGSSEFSSRSNRMKMLEEGKKPIRYFDYEQKTKRLQKRLQRLHVPRKTSDEILSEFRNHEKRLEAFRLEEARKPENQARRKHAESLFEPTPTTLFKTFEQNSLTQALDRVSAIAQRDELSPETQESIRAFIAKREADETAKVHHDRTIIDDAISIIQHEVQAGNTQLKGIRQAYRRAGLTAKRVNKAVISEGVAKSLVEFEKQTAKDVKQGGEKHDQPQSLPDLNVNASSAKTDLSVEESVIDKASTVIREVFEKNGGSLKGIRTEYKNAGITAKHVNDAVIAAGIADNVSQFERQIKSDLIKAKDNQEVSDDDNDKRVHSSNTQASGRGARGGRDVQHSVGERDDSGVGDAPSRHGGETERDQSTGGVRDLLSTSDVGRARSSGALGNDTQRSEVDRDARTHDDGARRGLLTPSTQNASNYHIDDPKKLIGGTAKARFKRNQLALAVREKISNGEPLTESDRDVIAAYSGWGSFGQELFNGTWNTPHPKEGWESESQWLREQLGQEAWNSAQRSILNSHYTDPVTVSSMWAMARKLGFNGGRVLEPAMGVGNFFALMPKALVAKSTLTGIEMDSVTGEMAKALYPDANIQIKPYQDSKTVDGFYDLVIGNWPFHKDGPADRRYLKLAPSLHDYFFLKALDQTRAGGLVIGITSAGTMDKKGAATRAEISKKGKLIAAFRLPTGAFKEYAGTNVVTDILILQKRDKPLAQAADGWLSSMPGLTSSSDIFVNEYFHQHPSHILGQIEATKTSAYGKPVLEVKRPTDAKLKNLLTNTVIELLPANIMTQGKRDSISYISNNTDERQNAIILQDGQLHVVQGEHLANLSDLSKHKVKSEQETQRREDEIKSLIALRKTHGALLDAERDDAPTVDSYRTLLAKQYRHHVKQYGKLNRKGRGFTALKIFKDIGDPFYYNLAALEVGEDLTPAAILSKRISRGSAKIKDPTIAQAFVLSRNNTLGIDLQKIATLANQSIDEVKTELTKTGAIFKLPDGHYEVSDIYLSGNVRRKLQEAIEAKELGDADMEQNIRALEKVLPPDTPYHNIEVRLGAGWIRPEIYKQFVLDLAGLEGSDVRAADLNVGFRNGGWSVKPGSRINQAANSTRFKTDRRGFNELVQAAFNNKTIKVYSEDRNGAKFLDTAASDDANNVVALIREEFEDWVWKDPARRIELEKDYNNTVNVNATPSYDGSFMDFPGMALQLGDSKFNLRRHQVNAIWRGIAQKRGLYAHEVGTGKSFTIGGIAVESRRFGLAKKPLVIAHNANSKALAGDITTMYPGAKVLYIDNLSPATIDLKLRQIVNDDWDAVVIPHSLIDRFSLTEDTLMGMAQDEILEMEQEAIEAAEEGDSELSISDMDVLLDAPDSQEAKTIRGKLRSPTAKQLVATRNKIIETIRKQALRSSKENAISFEDLGIDMIIIDEVHEFKKPPIRTKMAMKGLNKQTSNRSLQLKFLTDFVKQKRGDGTGVHSFTGTPLTNTLTELYHHQRYVMDWDMEREGIKDWDQWFNTFAGATTDAELNQAGEYEPVTRLAQFINLPELRRTIAPIMDIVFADDMPEFAPRTTSSGKTLNDPTLTDKERDYLINGRTETPTGRPYKKIINDTAEMGPIQEAELAEIQSLSRQFKNATGKERLAMLKNGHPASPILLETRAAKAGLDIRLIDNHHPDEPLGKSNRVVNNLLDIYQSSPHAAQAVFVQMGNSDSTTRSRTVNGTKIKTKVKNFNLVKEIKEKLIAGGIPEHEIAIVKGDTKAEERKKIADAMNDGGIRVVIGNTQTLGVGVNMQRNLRAMHHLDAPWEPGSLEQRNGRGHRQGNTWNTVLEYRYITERLDGRRWQVLSVKDNFIKGFLKSKGEQRVLEGDAVDESESVLETLSQAAGDPRLFIRTKLAKEVERLQKRERLHAQSVYDAKQNKSKYQETLARLQEASTQMPELKAWLESGSQMTLGGRSVGLKKANETLSRLIESSVNGGQIGAIGDFNLVFNPGWKSHYLEVHAPNGLVIARTETFSLNALKANIRNAIKNLPSYIREEKRNLNSAQEAIDAPFGRAQELAQKTQKLHALEQDLAKNPTPPPLWLRDGAPISTSVFYNGQEYEVVGHRWGESDFYVLADNGKGEIEIPYLSAQDAQGMAIYEQHDFEAPGAVDKIDNAPQTGEQTQKALDDTLSDPVFSRSLLGDRVDDKESITRITDDRQAIAVRRWVSLILRDINANWLSGFDDVVVVSSEQYLPDAIKNKIDRDGANNEIEGVYYNGITYLVADKLHDKSSVERVLFHEFIGHHGIRKVFEGKVVEKELNKIWKKLGSEKQLLKIAKEMDIDLTAYIESYNRAYWNKEITLEQRQASIVDEMIAHMAGSKRFSSNWNRLVIVIKEWLRNHGFPNLAKYGKAELIELVSQAQKAALENTHSEISRERKQTDIRRNIGYPGDDIQFSRKDAFNEPMPVQTLQDILSKADGNMFDIIKDKVSGFGIDKLKDNKYALLTLDQLAELGKKRLPPIAHYEQTVREMETTQNLLIEDVANLTEEVRAWAQKDPKTADKLFEMMHQATLAGVDPSKPFESMTEMLQQEADRLHRRLKSTNSNNAELTNRRNEILEAIKKEPLRRQEHARLRERYSKLPKDAQRHFDSMKHHYTAQRGRMRLALEASIKRAQLDASVKKEMMRNIRFDHERAEKELYFPLARFGDYWIDVADENGERTFMMFETQSEMERKLKALEGARLKPTHGTRLHELQQLDGASMGFVTDLINNIKGIKNLNNEYKEEIADTIYQLYLSSMPDRSIRRAFIHRKGVAGFSNDAIRAMADQGFKQSRQQARLEHMDELEISLKAMKDITESSNSVESGRVYNEVVKRHGWVLNPARSPVAQKLTSLGFVWMLGLSPASALTNLTQSLIIALPMIGARHGMAKSSLSMTKASQDFMAGISKRLKSGDASHGIVGHVLNGLEKKAIRDAILAGCIDTTQAADLVGLAENPSAKYNGTYNKAMNIIGWAFHHAEVMNREVTFLAAYRLEYAQTKNHDDAVQKAIRLTNKAHFNYGSLNRARFMQGDVAAVALQFKQYAQNMIYYLVGNLYNAFRAKDISREEKRVAKKQLLWTLGVTFGIGGLGALPLSGLMVAANAAHGLFGDDDDPFDPESELKQMLSDYFGSDIASSLWYGSVPSLSSRISLDGLIWRDVNRDETPGDFYQSALMQLSGPVIGGIGLSIANGIGDIHSGQVSRGAEKMVPKAIKDILKTVRYTQEGGVVNKYGSPLIDDLSASEITQQALGFTPGRVSMRYDQNSAQKDAEIHVKNRRSQLMVAYYMGWRDGDPSDLKTVMAKVQAYNRSKWGRMMPIKGIDLQRSIRRRQMNLAESKNGMKLNRKLSDLTKELEYFSN